jgi:hypothetical protein
VGGDRGIDDGKGWTDIYNGANLTIGYPKVGERKKKEYTCDTFCNFTHDTKNTGIKQPHKETSLISCACH